MNGNKEKRENNIILFYFCLIKINVFGRWLCRLNVQIDTEVKRRLWRGDANPPEGMMSPSDSVWRRVSSKDDRNICNRPKDETRGEGSKAGKRRVGRDQRPCSKRKAGTVHVMDKV